MKILSYEIKKTLKKTKDVQVYQVFKHDKVKIVKLVKSDGNVPNSNYQTEFNHPNIIRCFEKGVLKLDDEIFNYSILEWANKESLEENAEEFKNNPYDFFYDICKGMKYLHENNVIHGDLKPSNILIDSRNGKLVCKISDYDSTTGENNKFFVTPEIISPEWTKEFNVQSDIWALGTLLYKQIIGYFPFGSRTKGDSYNNIIDRILNQPLDKSEFIKIEEPFRWVIYRCLQKNPQHRFTSMDEIMSELNDRRNFSKMIYHNFTYLKGAFKGNLR